MFQCFIVYVEHLFSLFLTTPPAGTMVNDQNKMELHKYRTHGNDYIVIDNRTGAHDDQMLDTFLKSILCNRLFGFGAIGIVEIRTPPSDSTELFEMVYHLGTGVKGRACGTGARCSVAYAQDAGIVERKGRVFDYLAFDGNMQARIKGSQVTQTMSNDCRLLKRYDENSFFVDVAWWVHVRFVADGISSHDIVAEGLAETDTAKYSHIPAPTYILAEIVAPRVVKMRSFDRTAKDYEEMYACGTGGIAMCISYLHKHNLYGTHEISLVWQYGVTKACITRDGENSYSNITLTGHSRHVFSSTIDTAKFKKDYTFFQNDCPHSENMTRSNANLT